MMKGLLLLILTYPLVGSMPPSDKTLVSVTVKETILYVGMNTVVSIWVEVEQGYHIQANKVNDESLIPTTLEVKGHEFVTVDKQEFPPGKQFKLEGTDSLLSVYDGKFLIKLFLSPKPKAKTASVALSGKLHYQACDSRSCLFPRSVDFSIPIEVK